MPKSSKLQKILDAIPTMTTAALHKHLDSKNKQVRMKSYAELVRRRSK